MKVCILAGGLGSRLSEETVSRPKPMVEIGGNPILWHIMKIFTEFNYNEFVIALGYRGDVIKDYFLRYHHRSNSLSINVGCGEVATHTERGEQWLVHLLETGEKSMTGGRIKQMLEFAGAGPVFVTYGDGVANVNIKQLLDFHRREGKLATVTAVRPPARFGVLSIEGELVTSFEEKPQMAEGWINGGFFVLEREVAEYIADNTTVFEIEPLRALARDKQLAAFKHTGFWHCMDTLRDVRTLDGLWREGRAPWRSWN